MSRRPTPAALAGETPLRQLIRPRAVRPDDPRRAKRWLADLIEWSEDEAVAAALRQRCAPVQEEGDVRADLRGECH